MEMSGMEMRQSVSLCMKFCLKPEMNNKNIPPLGDQRGELREGEEV